MNQPQAQVVPLYATPLVECQHPDPDGLNAELKRLFLARAAEGDKYRNRLMTAGKNGLFESEFDLFKWPEACVQRLRQYCFEQLLGAVRQLNGYSEAQVRSLGIIDDTWFHLTRHGGYTTAHTHPMASWSGVYCVEPGEQPAEHPDSGVLRFFDPRVTANMYLDAGNANLVRPFGSHLVNIRFRPGMLVLFPSFMQHEVAPFMGQDVRITVAFNVQFRGGR